MRTATTITLTTTYLLLVLLTVKSSLVLELDGQWKLEDSTRNYQELNANVPGGIYTDLMENKILEDVFFGFRDVETRWVAQNNWTYFRNFVVDEALLAHDNIKLVFDGLDTFSQIILNDHLIGTSENMFVQYIFDVLPYLQNGINTLQVRFTSPILMAKHLFEKQAMDYLVPPACVPIEYNGECHANHIRKMQASFSWDWGPALPSVGIWKSVRIEAYNSGLIRHVLVSTEADQSDNWNVKVTTYFDGNINDELLGDLLIRLQTNLDVVETIYDISFTNIGNGELVHTAMFTIPKLHVDLWWPNGYGNPTLYQMTVTFKSSNQEEMCKKTLKIGFRTISLVQDKIGTKQESGLSFYFIVNNVPIFAKGTNSIPLNILPEKGYDSTTIQFLLKSAQAAHMNMIRVWGGGVYESDEFYEVCDELGIMVWQDFMFACAMYPVNEEFLSTVKEEVRYQVRRLQYHPSIILWAANNENEAALRQDWYGTYSDFELYKSDFIKLYVDTIRNEVFKSDTSRQFLTSSPTNGLQSELDGYIALNPASNFFGDVHYYNYLTDSWEQDSMPIPRFSSEYGLQSFPTIPSLLTATNSTTDLLFNSNFMKHRQHHPGGNEEMLALMSMRLPIVSNENENFYKAYIFYTQIHQSMGIKLQTEKYRIWRSSLNIIDQGFTMGALYWQLNDVWMAPTWSGIDFNLNWKMLHYYAKKFFSPILIAGYQSTSRNVSIHIVSDLTSNIYNATATVNIYNWDSFEPVHTENHQAIIMSGLSTSITSFWVDTTLSEAQCGTDISAKYECFLHLSLTDNNGLPLAPDNFLFPAALKDSHLRSSTVKIGAVTQMTKDGTEYDIQVITDGIALFVWLEVDKIKGIFSDNGFMMITKATVVKFYPNAPTSLDEIKNYVTVTHLTDSQYF
ncbi:beta-mannosidase [Onthophagus taurus]|uniref:beta-mannosidase n=1 Tax=Onthophagus taurus TaxID=166361 RepID=UPI0039BE7C98